MKTFSLILFASIIMFSCKDNAQSNLENNIKKLEQNKSLANSDTLINSYLTFVKNYPNEPNAIKYLFKAAEGNVKAKRNAEAAKLYEQLATNYKDSATLASESLIRAGFNYEFINDVPNAKRVFNEFLTRYPTHERAADIKGNLEIISLSKAQQDSVMMERIINRQ